MDGTTGKAFQDLGPQMTHVDHLLGNFRGGLHNAYDVAHRVVGVRANDEVRRGQEIKMENLVADVSRYSASDGEVSPPREEA